MQRHWNVDVINNFKNKILYFYPSYSFALSTYQVLVILFSLLTSTSYDILSKMEKVSVDFNISSK